MVAGAASTWGLWPLILRRAERFGAISPELESAVALAALTVISGAAMLRDRSPRGLARPATAWLSLAWLGVSDALNVVFYFRAIQTTTVAVAVLTHYLTPLFVALGAPLFLRERVTRRTYAAVVVAFFGLVLLLEPWGVGAQAAGSRMLVGAAFGAASALFYASNVLFNKRLVPYFTGSELACYHGAVAVPIIVALTPVAAWSAVDARAWPWLLSGAIGPGALAGLVFVWGLRRVPAAHASALTLLEPFVAVMVGIAVFQETPTAIGLIGAAMILIGAALVVRSR
jgi:drug/metabolite transporter (DMT)-like permease